MAKWVTFYEDSISGRIFDYTEHPDKETAAKYFKNHYAHYFELATKIPVVKLPMRYGYLFRAFYGMSLRAFKKRQEGEGK
jgi:hypothetical protein